MYFNRLNKFSNIYYKTNLYNKSVNFRLNFFSTSQINNKYENKGLLYTLL